MFKNPFSFEGRIRRLEYGLSHLIGTFILYLIAFMVGVISGSSGDEGIFVILFLFYIPYFWFIWAQGAKRCHDVGNSGWWQLIPLYPLWLLFEDGQAGPNQYGENPKGIQNIGGQTFQGGQNIGNTGGGYSGGYSGGHNNQNTNYGTSNNQFNQGSEYKEGDLYK